MSQLSGCRAVQPSASNSKDWSDLSKWILPLKTLSWLKIGFKTSDLRSNLWNRNLRLWDPIPSFPSHFHLTCKIFIEKVIWTRRKSLAEAPFVWIFSPCVITKGRHFQTRDRFFSDLDLWGGHVVHWNQLAGLGVEHVLRLGNHGKVAMEFKSPHVWESIRKREQRPHSAKDWIITITLQLFALGGCTVICCLHSSTCYDAPKIKVVMF